MRHPAIAACLLLAATDWLFPGAFTVDESDGGTGDFSVEGEGIAPDVDSIICTGGFNSDEIEITGGLADASTVGISDAPTKFLRKAQAEFLLMLIQ